MTDYHIFGLIRPKCLSCNPLGRNLEQFKLLRSQEELLLLAILLRHMSFDHLRQLLLKK